MRKIILFKEEEANHICMSYSKEAKSTIQIVKEYFNVSKVKEVGRNHGGIFSSFCHTCPICLELVLFREKWRKGHTCRCHHFHLLWERKGWGEVGWGCCGPSTTTIHNTLTHTPYLYSLGLFFIHAFFPRMGYGLRIRTLNTPPYKEDPRVRRLNEESSHSYLHRSSKNG
jgi:hypothetical protein